MRLTLSLFGTACFILLVSLVIGNLGGCQARYRYPCQDPINWNKEECHNDICKVEGDCTSHTLGALYRREDSDADAAIETDTTKETATEEKTNPHSENHISSSSHEVEPVEQTEEISSAHEPEALTCTAGVTCTTDQTEQPLTMDTMVDTSGHNLAAR